MTRIRFGRIATSLAAAMVLAAALGAARAVAPAFGVEAPPPLPITALAPGKAGTRLVLLVTGEAGRSDFESALGRELAAGGSGVLILDAKAYLGTPKTPSRMAAESEEAIRRYAKVWNRPRLVIVGYSRGADVSPFIANRLSADLKDRLDAVVLLGPAGRASFELTLREAVTNRPRVTDLPVRPELERLRGTRLLCAYGREEPSPFCSRVDSTLMRVVVRAGGHKLALADGKPIAQLIVERLGQ
jgi:type IV secretory pathway VirJ component